MWERKQGNLRTCIQLLQRGQSLNSADPALYQAWAVVEKEMEQYDEARRIFKRGLEVDPAHVHLWQAWGVMEYQLGNLDTARELFQQGVWADPGNKDVVYVFQVSRREGGGVLRSLWGLAVALLPGWLFDVEYSICT